ncbi:TIGR03751 family conjugal transfer lipoprotein [Methylophaga sp.]|jgi:conjugative transfer region lipoprotein (TIGR03751 family)|uniref:TIGR03751 family conjugal transfer lipoprotein n=1 Tax=Methylophaga sp. TaxID=2024840 RepID=UPI000C0FF061|nr:TIGR03751 family conjugal transfer lipoprotein [Methylophaga sp.]MBL1456456.1 TIGR03751 family conjugal transfer lipoprotein [Methylophaga sp.]MBN45394.1 TIGR03751 family conjugal transfer lipoprotein [Methylophaga sp.]|tara:strand:- start:169 stop:570 length:402 start_codon:yes stop_codon:yes gene_type:complete
MRVTVAKTVIVTLISLLSACASQTKDDLLPQTGPTMEEVYRNHESNLTAGTSNGQSAFAGIRERQAGNYDADLDGYTRDANREIQQQFPRLPNPTLVMFVYPHLSTASRLPVPGYSTAFPFYERTEYAMPGEM